MVDLSIIIPCFNEAGSIEHTTQSVINYMSTQHEGISYELLLINDGSTDSTSTILQKLADSSKQVKIHSHSANKGIGAAIKTGFGYSVGTHVIVLDADLSYDVEHIGIILDRFKSTPAIDAVVISPYMRGGIVKNVPIQRYWLSRTANWLLAGLFSKKLSTVTCSVRGYRGNLIRNLPLFEDNKGLHLEIIRKLVIIGAKIAEVPGRLIWKDAPKRKGRRTLKTFHTAQNHIWWGVLARPTRFFKHLSIILFALGIYQTINLARVFFNFYEPMSTFWINVWAALSKTLSHSPHTVIIACVSLILGLQAFSFWAIMKVQMLQQEETMRHLIAIWKLHDTQGVKKG